MGAAGHSLPELLVALALLAASLGSVGAAGLVGSQRTARSSRATEAVLTAVAILDSVMVNSGSPPPSGSAARGRWRVEWAPSGEGVEAAIVAIGEDRPLFRILVPWSDREAPSALPERQEP